MRTWIAKLRVPKPPQAVVHDWKTGLDLLERAADKLDDAEAGDPEAQSEALWNLEPRGTGTSTRCTFRSACVSSNDQVHPIRRPGNASYSRCDVHVAWARAEFVRRGGVPGPGRRGGDSGCDAGARAEILARTDAADLDME